MLTMNTLPTHNTPDITLLPRPYGEDIDIESDNPNMLYVAQDVRSINPNAMIFQDTGRSMLDEGGLVLIICLLVIFVIMIPTLLINLLSEGFFGVLISLFLILLAFILPIVMLRKMFRLKDDNSPIDAFNRMDQLVLQYDVTVIESKQEVIYHGINELPYQDIHASVKSVNIVSAGGFSKTYFLQLNWLDDSRNIVNQLVSSFPATSDVYARAQWQFIRNYMEKDADSLPPIIPFDPPKTTEEHKLYLYTDSILPNYGVTQNFKIRLWYIPLLILQAYVKLGGGWIQSKGKNILNEPQYQHLQYPSDQFNPYLDPNIDPYRTKVINNQSKRFLWRWRIIWIIHTLLILSIIFFFYAMSGGWLDEY